MSQMVWVNFTQLLGSYIKTVSMDLTQIIPMVF